MITCPVCGTRNHHLTIVCGSCGGFIQGRVENLDLFSTIWKLIERPRAAFLSISLSRYKNYSTIVPSVAGIGLVFAFFWFIKAGDHTASAFNLLAGGIVAGPPTGVILTATMTILAGIILRISGISVRFRNLYAVLGYSLVPVVLSVVFVLPLEIFTFGRYFFSLNPPPWLLKPVSYYLFVSLGFLVVAWTISLAVTGMKVLLDCRWITSAGIVSGMAGFVLLLGWIARSFLVIPSI
ncbi:MAG TPA: YIP1 family protein [Bacteroidota bacterium]|nr:YIP1 family protein [Bacteroidota bacterium]